MGCCVGAEYGNWCEDVEIVWTDPETGDEYCLFHAPAEHKGIKASEFNKIVNKRIKEKRYELFVTLAGTSFPGDIEICDQYLHSLSLHSCRFYGDLEISRSTFESDLNLDSCTFFKNSCISHCTIMLMLSIENAVFLDNLYIRETHCYHFIDISFLIPPPHICLHTISLKNCKIRAKSQAYNRACTLLLMSEKYFDASTVTISNLNISTLFNPNELPLPINFIECTFDIFSSANYVIKHPINFISCTFKNLFLSPHNLNLLKFISCTTPTFAGRNVTSDIFSLPLKEPIHSHVSLKSNHPKYLENLYRSLKKEAQKNEDYRLISDWHYWEKYFCEKRLFAEGTAIEWLILRTYRLLSDYGESVGKATSWLLIFILASIFLGFLAPSPSTEADLTISPIANAALQYIPLGTSAPKESSWLRFFQIFWQFIITFQATLLGFALRNRYRR